LHGAGKFTAAGFGRARFTSFSYSCLLASAEQIENAVNFYICCLNLGINILKRRTHIVNPRSNSLKRRTNGLNFSVSSNLLLLHCFKFLQHKLNIITLLRYQINQL
jgi:hypothetical protein